MNDKLWCECSRQEQREFAYLRKIFRKVKEAFKEGKIGAEKFEEFISLIESRLDVIERKYD